MTSMRPDRPGHDGRLRRAEPGGEPRRLACAGRADRPFGDEGPRRPTVGLVALVGAGPGRADLITVRGRDLLERADVVVHDRLDTQELLAVAGTRTAAGRSRLVDVGKREGSHPVPQERINQILVEEAARSSLVVRLKGGDPYVFGRGGEEASALAAAGVPFEVVPGVTSALAALSYAGVPVTDRRCSASFHVLTGHRRANGELGIDYAALAAAGGTDVFLMAVRTLGEVTGGLLAAGLDPGTPACVVERGTLSEQRRIDAMLSSVADEAARAHVASPAILVVGEVCRLAGELGWYDALPLRGRTVAVTRPRGRARELAGRLRSLGARVLEAPLIETRPVPTEALVPVVRGLASYAWLVLTSAEGVRYLRLALDAAGLDARALAGLRVAAVGPATARELERLGVRADLVPDVFDTAHLGRALVGASVPGERALLFRSRQGSRDLTRVLGAAGVPYDDVVAYDTVACEEGAARLASAIDRGEVDAVALTSGSCARALASALAAAGEPRVPSGCVLACLGEATAGVARELGGRVVVAREATADALADAVLEALA